MLRRVKFTRNAVLFVAGLIGVAHQTFVENVDRPVLLALFGAMMGLPLFLGSDEKREKEEPKSPPETPPVVPGDASKAEVEE